MKKKLLHLQLLPLMSGVQRFSLHLLEGLPADDYDIYVACKPGGEFVDAVLTRGWKYLPIRTLRHQISVLDALALLELLYVMIKYRFDIVHTNSSKPGLLGRLAARVCNVPKIVHTIHGTSFQAFQSSPVRAFFMLMEKVGNYLGDHTVFVNNSDREKCLELGLVNPAKATSILNATAPDTRQMICKKQPSPQYVTIGSTIRFSDQKNVIALINAACKACHAEALLRFILLGDGEHYALCRSIVASHRLSERILLPGWDSDVAPWLAQFDAFILYSRWEAMPYSIIEAMQAGLPVIGSAIPSISEFVNEQSGWLVALDDEQELISTCLELAKNRAILLSKGAYALEHINRISNYDSMLCAYREIYEG